MTSSRIWSTLQRQISNECWGICQLVSIRQIWPWSNNRSSVSSSAPLHWQTAEEMGNGTMQPSAHTISTESRWHCQRTRTTCRNSRRQTRQRIPSSRWQFPLSASTYIPRNIMGSLSTKQIHDSTRPHTSCYCQETSALPQRPQEHHPTMVRSRLHWASQARHHLWLCGCILCRYNSSIDTHQSDTSSCSTELLSLDARVELLWSFSTQQKPSCKSI